MKTNELRALESLSDAADAVLAAMFRAAEAGFVSAEIEAEFHQSMHCLMAADHMMRAAVAKN